VQISGPRGAVLNVKRLKQNSYFARIRGSQHARRGDVDQIVEDIEYFQQSGKLPEGLGGVERNIPAPGTRVRFEPSEQALDGYTRHPAPGEEGRVVLVPVQRRKVHYLPGPGGGTLYVRWDKAGALGVSLSDVALD
jgi:hypothetical protein